MVGREKNSQRPMIITFGHLIHAHGNISYFHLLHNITLVRSELWFEHNYIKETFWGGSYSVGATVLPCQCHKKDLVVAMNSRS